jgi:hypothetical protein
MSEWWTYTPSDLLMFSPRVYYRLVEAYNAAFWPAQIAVAAIGLFLAVGISRGSVAAGRAAFLLVGLAFAWTGWAFIWERYATINWPAGYLAPLFGVEALALIWFGALRQSIRPPERRHSAFQAGLLLFAAVIVLYPALAWAMGRGWPAAASFGFAPDPTAIAALALLAISEGRMRWLLFIIPTLWCAVSATTLWTMEEADFFVPLAAALVAIALGVAAGRQSAPPSELRR